jgi:hypothetical protein
VLLRKRVAPNENEERDASEQEAGDGEAVTGEEEEEGEEEDEDFEPRVINRAAIYMKFYATFPWYYILDRARHLSCLAAVVDGFPDCLAMLDFLGDEYLNQAMSEYEERGVNFDQGLYEKYGYEMKVLVSVRCTCNADTNCFSYTTILAHQQIPDFGSVTQPLCQSQCDI